MPIDKSDKTAIYKGRIRTYKYSHVENIIVCENIWKRHIWIRQDSPNYWEQNGENRLMEFEPTDIPDTSLDTIIDDLFGDDT